MERRTGLLEEWGLLMSAMLRSAMTVAPIHPLPPLPASDWAQPPPHGDVSALLSKRSGTSSSSEAAVGMTSEVNDNFASFADAVAAAVIVDASSYLAAAAKLSEMLLLASLVTAMEKTVISSNSNNEEKAVILRSDFVNIGVWGCSGKDTINTTTTRTTGPTNATYETK